MDVDQNVLRETATDPLAEYRRVSVEGTQRLAELAADIRESWPAGGV